MAKPLRVSVDPDLSDIMDRYLEIRREELALIRQAHAEGNLEQVRFLAHRLKGTGGSYGLDELTRLGRDIESAARQEQLREADALIGELEDYLSRLEVVYEEPQA